MKKIISFSLWGDQPLYTNGAINNVVARDKFFPGWICRFYIDETMVPIEVIKKLETSEGVEIVKAGHVEDVLGMFWRFRPMWEDTDTERFIVRDTDSLSTQREAWAVNDWIQSGKPFHIIRDNKYHNIQILGGTWGAVPGCIPDMQKAVQDFLGSVRETKSQHASRKYHGADQAFLCHYVWPFIKDNHIAHVRAGESNLKITGHEIELPPLEENGHFIGMPCELVDGKCVRVESHLLVNGKKPERTYDKICLMLPSYKRIKKLERIINSAIETATDSRCLRFCFCVNKNDEETAEFLRNKNWPEGVEVEIIYEDTEQPNLSHYYNLMYEKTKFNDKGTLVSMLGDDMVFLTKGWEAIILDSANSKEGKCLIYCNDLAAKEGLCVNLFTTRLVVDAAKKKFMCPYFHADMIDVVWYFIGRMVGLLCYHNDVVIEHQHDSKLPPDQWDETFKRLNPIRRVANSKENQHLAIVYATLCASNLIENGIGKWNIL